MQSRILAKSFIGAAMFAVAVGLSAPASAALAAQSTGQSATHTRAPLGGMIQEARYRGGSHYRHHYRHWRPARICRYEMRRRWVNGTRRIVRVRICSFR